MRLNRRRQIGDIRIRGDSILMPEQSFCEQASTGLKPCQRYREPKCQYDYDKKLADQTRAEEHISRKALRRLNGDGKGENSCTLKGRTSRTVVNGLRVKANVYYCVSIGCEEQLNARWQESKLACLSIPAITGEPLNAIPRGSSLLETGMPSVGRSNRSRLISRRVAVIAE
jgi:hypothetical protein